MIREGVKIDFFSPLFRLSKMGFYNSKGLHGPRWVEWDLFFCVCVRRGLKGLVCLWRGVVCQPEGVACEQVEDELTEGGLLIFQETLGRDLEESLMKDKMT